MATLSPTRAHSSSQGRTCSRPQQDQSCLPASGRLRTSEAAALLPAAPAAPRWPRRRPRWPAGWRARCGPPPAAAQQCVTRCSRPHLLQEQGHSLKRQMQAGLFCSGAWRRQRRCRLSHTIFRAVAWRSSFQLTCHANCRRRCLALGWVERLAGQYAIEVDLPLPARHGFCGSIGVLRKSRVQPDSSPRS